MTSGTKQTLPPLGGLRTPSSSSGWDGNNGNGADSNNNKRRATFASSLPVETPPTASGFGASIPNTTPNHPTVGNTFTGVGNIGVSGTTTPSAGTTSSLFPSSNPSTSNNNFSFASTPTNTNTMTNSMSTGRQQIINTNASTRSSPGIGLGIGNTIPTHAHTTTPTTAPSMLLHESTTTTTTTTTNTGLGIRQRRTGGGSNQPPPPRASRLSTPFGNLDAPPSLVTDTGSGVGGGGGGGGVGSTNVGGSGLGNGNSVTNAGSIGRNGGGILPGGKSNMKEAKKANTPIAQSLPFQSSFAPSSNNYSSWVAVYGFTNAKEFKSILSQFESFGTIKARYPISSPARWVCLKYESQLQADKALCQHGCLMDAVRGRVKQDWGATGSKDVMIVGVMRMDMEMAIKLGLKNHIENGSSGVDHGGSNSIMSDKFHNQKTKNDDEEEEDGEEEDSFTSQRQRGVLMEENDVLLTEDTYQGISKNRALNNYSSRRGTNAVGWRRDVDSVCEKVISWLFNW